MSIDDLLIYIDNVDITANINANYFLEYTRAGYYKEAEPVYQLSILKPIPQTIKNIYFPISRLVQLKILKLKSAKYFDELSLLMILLIFYYISLIVVTLLYHLNMIRNYLLVAILGIIGTIVGGIFILAGQQKNELLIDDSLENKLKELDLLYLKGIITQEEFTLKRKTLIEKQ